MVSSTAPNRSWLRYRWIVVVLSLVLLLWANLGDKTWYHRKPTAPELIIDNEARKFRTSGFQIAFNLNQEELFQAYDTFIVAEDSAGEVAFVSPIQCDVRASLNTGNTIFRVESYPNTDLRFFLVARNKETKELSKTQFK